MRQRGLVSAAVRGEDAAMDGGKFSTALSPVCENGRWRVRTWPSGITKYFGKFDDERQAVGWIDTHRWLSRDTFDSNDVRRKPRKKSS